MVDPHKTHLGEAPEYNREFKTEIAVQVEIQEGQHGEEAQNWVQFLLLPFRVHWTTSFTASVFSSHELGIVTSR